MNIKIYIKPGSKERNVVEKKDLLGNTVYEVYVRSLPKDGEANKELIETLAEYFKTQKSKITIKSGFKSRNKIISIQEV